MPRYGVYFFMEAMEVLPKGGVQRRRIMDFLYGLREQPNTPGDYVERGPDSHDYQVKIIGKHSVHYWVDDPVKLVMVANVRLADR